jgi:hypothetical protein
LDGAELASFLAYAAGFSGGVRVATGDFNGNQRSDIITAPGAGGGPHVRVFNGQSPFNELRGLLAYESNFAGGVYVAGSPSGASGASLLAANPPAANSLAANSLASDSTDSTSADAASVALLSPQPLSSHPAAARPHGWDDADAQDPSSASVPRTVAIDVRRAANLREIDAVFALEAWIE